MIGESVAALVEERIAETITADAGRHRLALLHGIKSAAGHVAGDVPFAKFAGVGFKRSLIILPVFFLGVGSFRGVAWPRGAGGMRVIEAPP